MSRKVSLWWGRGFWMETIAENDGSYHLSIKSPDFSTPEEVAQVEQYFQNLFMRGLSNG